MFVIWYDICYVLCVQEMIVYAVWTLLFFISGVITAVLCSRLAYAALGAAAVSIRYPMWYVRCRYKVKYVKSFTSHMGPWSGADLRFYSPQPDTSLYTARPRIRGPVYVAACLFIPQLSPVGLPNYTAWWQRHIGVRNLHGVFTP